MFAQGRNVLSTLQSSGLHALSAANMRRFPVCTIYIASTVRYFKEFWLRKAVMNEKLWLSIFRPFIVFGVSISGYLSDHRRLF